MGDTMWMACWVCLEGHRFSSKHHPDFKVGFKKKVLHSMAITINAYGGKMKRGKIAMTVKKPKRNYNTSEARNNMDSMLTSLLEESLAASKAQWNNVKKLKTPGQVLLENSAASLIML